MDWHLILKAINIIVWMCSIIIPLVDGEITFTQYVLTWLVLVVVIIVYM